MTPNPTTALPAAFSGGAGTINRMNGTGWYTLDANGVWRGWRDLALLVAGYRAGKQQTRAKR
jgi:hypothetical protein